MTSGYIWDRERAFKFFRNKLHYDVFCGEDYTNCTKKQLLKQIAFIQDEIRRKAADDEAYDKFVFIILTHGKRVGQQ